MIDRSIKDKELKRLANITAPTLIKLKTDKIVTTETICKICAALNVQPEEIMEYLPDQDNNK
jgi:DNA-binding Xre family transcriptional regulator